MKKNILLIACLIITKIIFCQQHNAAMFNLYAGAIYSNSNDEFMNNTGIGVFLEPSLTFGKKFKTAFRFEPLALAYGVLLLPGGCTEEHPRYPGIPTCREGANYLLNNYFIFDYLIGQSKSGKKGGHYQSYLGMSFNIHTHRRYVITSRVPGNWRDTAKWIIRPGTGIRIGYLLGKFNLSVAYNFIGKDFQDYLGMSLSYRIR